MCRMPALETVLCLLLVLNAADSRAQTIAEYSAAQRLALQAEMQKAMRPVVAASPPEAAASEPARRPVPPVAPTLMRAPEPPLEIAGVSLVRGRAWIEAVVAGRVHWLEVGSAVPGTGWILSAATSTEVVLVRRHAHAKRPSDARPQVDERRVVRLEALQPRL